ncbi:hypothetical protein JOC36_000145 [Weissella uvarum]|nr:hypothetical protein [Weissella uvarum]
MHEDKQNNNHISTNGRVRGTREYLDLYLHPWNNDRIFFYMHAIVTATLIFENNANDSITRMVSILNNRLDSPFKTR